MGTLVNGIKEIFATAKTTGSNVMLCGNDGTPDGHMTMANLASVLGVLYNSQSPIGVGQTATSCDDAPLNCTVNVFSNATEKPTSNDDGFITTFANNTDPNYRYQIFYDLKTNKYYVRGKRATNWHSWIEISTDIPTFYKNYNDLSSLGSALGVGVSTEGYRNTLGGNVANIVKFRFNINGISGQNGFDIGSDSVNIWIRFFLNGSYYGEWKKATLA